MSPQGTGGGTPVSWPSAPPPHAALLGTSSPRGSNCVPIAPTSPPRQGCWDPLYGADIGACPGHPVLRTGGGRRELDLEGWVLGSRCPGAPASARIWQRRCPFPPTSGPSRGCGQTSQGLSHPQSPWCCRWVGVRACGGLPRGTGGCRTAGRAVTGKPQWPVNPPPTRVGRRAAPDQGRRQGRGGWAICPRLRVSWGT